MTYEAPSMENLPLICTLTPGALRVRREGLLSDLLRRADAHEQMSEGIRLRFAPSFETLPAIICIEDAT